jgi:NADH-quinone oxidoreductase subunit H
MQVLLVAFHILVFPGLLFEILMGILLLGTCNKLVARMQNRVGPPIIQPWYDFLKCCGKETIVPRAANRNIYLWHPVCGSRNYPVNGTVHPVRGNETCLRTV